MTSAEELKVDAMVSIDMKEISQNGADALSTILKIKRVYSIQGCDEC